MRPQSIDSASHYQKYIQLATGADINEAFAIAENNTTKYLETIPAEKGDYTYATGKWTIKQLLQHIIDTERIFAYRALCIARGDQTTLPGFDENEYATHATAANRTLHELVEEFKLVNACTKALFKSFTTEDLQRVGTASNNKIKVLALGFIILGHNIHHLNVLKERYLVQSVA